MCFFFNGIEKVAHENPSTNERQLDPLPKWGFLVFVILANIPCCTIVDILYFIDILIYKS